MKGHHSIRPRTTEMLCELVEPLIVCTELFRQQAAKSDPKAGFHDDGFTDCQPNTKYSADAEISRSSSVTPQERMHCHHC